MTLIQFFQNMLEYHKNKKSKKKMKKVKHSETTSTIFFENNEEMENFKKELLKQGGIKFNPDDV